MEALQKHVAFGSVNDFYLLARTAMVKDERYYDKFDRAFALYFKDLETLNNFLNILIPEEWLRQEFVKSLTDEEKAEDRESGRPGKADRGIQGAPEGAERPSRRR